mmetsp:Transcript_39198/g.92762  ORF Transcript_39198/g.92762 Transcript_39198/m.92762 type:complete len:221 (+) Transcript_39198:359-1021(+)
MDPMSAIPSKWFGLSAGSSGVRYAMRSTRSSPSFPKLPPIANPSKGSEERYAALSARSSLSVPPCTTAYIACCFRSLRCSFRLRASHLWDMRTDSRRRSWVTRRGGSSSKGMMMSAPIAFCACTVVSGVRRIDRPSLYDRKVTPSSEVFSTEGTLPLRFAAPVPLMFPSLMSCPTDPYARENTWNPPESVMSGRVGSRPMNLCKPPAFSIISVPGWRRRW